MGRRDGLYQRFTTEGTVLLDARAVCESDHAGQARDEEHVRMPDLQDQNARTYVCLDIQSENPRETH